VLERVRSYGIVVVFIALFVTLAIASPSFLSLQNAANILDQSTILLIFATTTTVAVIAGVFDLSIAAVATAAAIMTVNAINWFGAFPGVVVGLLFGGLLGFISGTAITATNVNSFIGTLATSFMFFGAGFLISSRSLMRPESDAYRLIARSRFLGLTSATWIAIGVVIIATILLSRTRFGRNVFAVGGNMEAARLAGVAVNRVQTTAFLLLGAAAALAGVLNSSRSISAQPSDDFSFVFAVLTAVIVGGTSIAGGQGAIWRTTTAAFFLAFLNNGFNLLQIDPIWQRLIEGAVIIMAVAVDTWTKNRRA